MSTEERNVCLVKLTEKAERYHEMADYSEKVGAEAQELSVEVRNLLSGACKYAVGRRRAACKIITSVESKEKSKGNEDCAKYASEYCSKVEVDLQKFRFAILVLLDKLVPIAEGLEPKVFFQKMTPDYYRYIAQFTDGDKKKEAAEHARKSYAEAQAIAEQDLVVPHSIRLVLALNYSVLVEMNEELRVWLSG